MDSQLIAFVQGFVFALLLAFSWYFVSRPRKAVYKAPIGGDDECKMVLLVRTDLQMGKGKVAAQCSHAAVAAYQRAALQTDINKRWLSNWEEFGTTKITLKCPDEENMYY